MARDQGKARRVAVVTGGGRGIGRGISLALRRLGVHVVIAQRSPPPADLDLGFHQLDLADARSIQAFVSWLESTHGGADILINNAGLNHNGTLKDFDAELWQALVAVHLTGPLRLTSLLSQNMKRQGWGRIVNIGSVAVKHDMPFNMMYGATKAALLYLTQTWARELAGDGVTVNIVHPGIVETELTSPLSQWAAGAGISVAEAYGRALGRSVGIRRAITPDEVGECVAFLCRDNAAAITGQALGVDGGDFSGASR